MHIRVVRFTDVDPARIDSIVQRINESDGPPEGVRSSGIQLLHDPDQNTAVVVQMFDSAEDMAEGEKVFAAMDAGDTPGTRASVDRCEVKVEKRA